MNARTTCHGTTRISPVAPSYVGFSMPEPDEMGGNSPGVVRSAYEPKPCRLAYSLKPQKYMSCSSDVVFARQVLP